MHLIYVPLFYKCYLCVIGRSIYCRKIHLTIFHKYYYVIADFLSLCSDLPGFPHFAGDSRISKTIVVSPSPHVINMYEYPHIDNSLLVILFSLVPGADLFVTATFLLSVYLAIVRILTLRFRCANFAFCFNGDCFWLGAIVFNIL